jgi:hypothetical protein
MLDSGEMAAYTDMLIEINWHRRGVSYGVYKHDNEPIDSIHKYIY